MFRKIIKDRINRFKYYRLINNTGYDKEFSFSESVEHYKSKNEIYLYFCSYYEYRLPKAIKEHREYIEENNKGFGESAFHAMWWKLLLEFKPKNMLEIGVYRGQVISLWALISEMLHRDVDIHGISPFSSFGDSVSEYMKNLDYYQDVKSTFSELNLKTPTFTRGFSNEPQSVKAIKDKAWDLIYIDGGMTMKMCYLTTRYVKRILNLEVF